MTSTVVVCAGLAATDDATIATERAALRSFGAGIGEPAHRPHLTLTAARTADVDRITALASAVAARHAPIALVLGRAGTFRRGAVVWLAPQPSPSLAALQRDAYDTLRAAGHPPAFGAQSDPDAWAAHCTLARRVDPALVDRWREGFVPCRVTVAALAVLLVGGRGDVARIELACGTNE